MAEITVSNATFDAALGNVPAPYGPGTRAGTSTDVESPAIVPNSEVRYLVLSDNGDEVMITYSELIQPEVRDAIFRQSVGFTNSWINLSEMIEALYDITFGATAFDAISAPDVDVQGFLRLFKAVSYLSSSDNPLESWIQTAPGSSEPLEAAFTSTFVDPTVTIDTMTGDYLAGAFVWSWGDGSYSWDRIPAPHTYVGADTYTITLLMVGIYGEISIATDDVIVT